MVPATYSKSSIGNTLTAEDIFALNQIPNVDLSREAHGQFALSDLVLEASHFLDEEVVNRLEMQILSQKVKEDWNLP